jgi:hypothetical protein
MNNTGQLYQSESAAAATHLALNWRGRLRYVVPRSRRAQRAAWRFFHPGRIRIVLEAMTRMPRLLGAVPCVENNTLALIRAALDTPRGFSCGAGGAEGAWSKDTVLLLREGSPDPACLVKAGTGAMVDRLLRWEAHWLQTLDREPALRPHIPGLLAHRAGAGLSFLAQTPLPGRRDFRLGAAHFEFLRALHRWSGRSLRYPESGLARNLRARLGRLQNKLPQRWIDRLGRAVDRVEAAYGDSSSLFAVSHGDFSPWNTLIHRSRLLVFDWEFAAEECLPLFDPLHFALKLPALKAAPLSHTSAILEKTLAACAVHLPQEFCRRPKAQALAYLVHVCTHFLDDDPALASGNAALDAYAALMDHLLAGVGQASVAELA